MPKIAANGAATAYGQEGVVQSATGELWELDPSRNLDGTAVDGYASDERDLSDAEERETPARPDDEPRPQPVDEPKEDDSEAQEKSDESDEPEKVTGTFAVDKEEKPSPGTNSRTSVASRGRNANK